MADVNSSNLAAKADDFAHEAFRIKALAQGADSLIFNQLDKGNYVEIIDSVGLLLELIISETDKLAIDLMNCNCKGPVNAVSQEESHAAA